MIKVQSKHEDQEPAPHRLRSAELCPRDHRSSRGRRRACAGARDTRSHPRPIDRGERSIERHLHQPCQPRLPRVDRAALDLGAHRRCVAGAGARSRFRSRVLAAGPHRHGREARLRATDGRCLSARRRRRLSLVADQPAQLHVDHLGPRRCSGTGDGARFLDRPRDVEQPGHRRAHLHQPCHVDPHQPLLRAFGRGS